MRTTQTMTVSLPPAIMKELEIYRQKNNFTRSELVRHALRELFYRQFPVYRPTKAEIKKIEAGRRAFMRCEYLSLDEAFNELDSKNHQASAKGLGKIARKRSHKN